MSEDALEVYEERFRRAGLPLFVEDVDAETDVWNRAFPVLALVFIAEMLGGLNLEWGIAANLAAGAGSLAIAIGGVLVVNRLRGRKVLAIPESIGGLELAAFVVLPAVLPYVFGGQVTSALVTLAGNVLLLVLLYGILAAGLVAIVRWAARRLARQLLRSLSLLARAIPLLLLFSVVLFINTEMWEVFARMDVATLAAVVALLVTVGSGFVALRLPRELDEIEDEAGERGPELGRRQLLNVGLVLFVGHALQVVVVTVAVAAFFVIFGLLTIDEAVVVSWLGSPGERIAPLGVDIGLTTELLRVATGIAAISGLYYAIAVLTDATYREEFLDDVRREMRANFVARAEYLRLRARAGADGPAAR